MTTSINRCNQMMRQAGKESGRGQRAQLAFRMERSGSWHAIQLGFSVRYSKWVKRCSAGSDADVVAAFESALSELRSSQGRQQACMHILKDSANEVADAVREDLLLAIEHIVTQPKDQLATRYIDSKKLQSLLEKAWRLGPGQNRQDPPAGPPSPTPSANPRAQRKWAVKKQRKAERVIEALAKKVAEQAKRIAELEAAEDSTSSSSGD
eukprot:TRINITY_DN66597_c0_g1_i1.p2 TRINITY_DN66597_c0_g1~~TRINITY_DN66597_c0_g1_i1.p2  ORF type:complete len:209 (+),score=60.38 TRINITY_DN66597_c0_g1_i1:79-705(+)